MIAAYVEKYGHNQRLKLGELPDPHRSLDDVVVRVRAASVNPVDFKVRDGKLRFFRPYRFPLILGHDCSGEVVKVGERVTKFKVGDRVFARPRNGRIGTFAEFIAIDQSEVALMPPNLAFPEAASLPLVGLTSWQALCDVAQLRAGQKILIQAGAGGIGTFAIQLAKHVGAEVWTTTSGKNEEFVKALGADHVVNYQKEKFEQVCSGLDVVFDTLGGEALDKSFSVVRPGGWIVSISGTPDERTAQDMGLGFWETLVLGAVGAKVRRKAKRAGVNYRFIFMKSLGSQLEQISNLVDRGAIRPVLDKVFPFSDVQAALDYSETGRARGKIVVSM